MDTCTYRVHGRLYPNPDTLVGSGLVDKEIKERRTNAYSIASRGRDVLEARREWEDQHLEYDWVLEGDG